MRVIIGQHIELKPIPVPPVLIRLPLAAAEVLLGIVETVEDLAPDEVAARLCLRQKLDGTGPSAYG
jgi:hypothetical protein